MVYGFINVNMLKSLKNRSLLKMFQHLILDLIFAIKTLLIVQLFYKLNHLYQIPYIIPYIDRIWVNTYNIHIIVSNKVTSKVKRIAQF
jgi:hypothetical protein